MSRHLGIVANRHNEQGCTHSQYSCAMMMEGLVPDKDKRAGGLGMLACVRKMGRSGRMARYGAGFSSRPLRRSFGPRSRRCRRSRCAWVEEGAGWKAVVIRTTAGRQSRQNIPQLGTSTASCLHRRRLLCLRGPFPWWARQVQPRPRLTSCKCPAGCWRSWCRTCARPPGTCRCRRCTTPQGRT
jgi:hypothetical protein